MEINTQNENNAVLYIWKVFFTIFFLLYPFVVFSEMIWEYGYLGVNGVIISDFVGKIIFGIMEPVISIVGFICTYMVWFIKKPVTIKYIKILIIGYLIRLLLSKIYLTLMFQRNISSDIIQMFVGLSIFYFMYKFFSQSDKVKNQYNI